MKQMPKVEISPDFTIEDIHKIREAKAAFVETLTPEERREFYKNEGMEFHRELQRRKAALLAENAKHSA